MYDDYSVSRLFSGMNVRMHEDSRFVPDEIRYQLNRKCSKLDSQALQFRRLAKDKKGKQAA